MSQFINAAEILPQGKYKAVLKKMGADMMLRPDEMPPYHSSIQGPDRLRQYIFRIKFEKAFWSSDSQVHSCDMLSGVNKEMEEVVHYIEKWLKNIIYGDLYDLILQCKIAVYERDFDEAQRLLDKIMEEIGG